MLPRCSWRSNGLRAHSLRPSGRPAAVRPLWARRWRAVASGARAPASRGESAPHPPGGRSFLRPEADGLRPPPRPRSPAPSAARQANGRPAPVAWSARVRPAVGSRPLAGAPLSWVGPGCRAPLPRAGPGSRLRRSLGPVSGPAREGQGQGPGQGHRALNGPCRALKWHLQRNLRYKKPLRRQNSGIYTFSFPKP